MIAGTPASGNLYDRWIEALGTSWADGTSIPGETTKELWDAKRLQTGLASWATLRHATALVNERTVGECGEGGFEWILLTPPRGYVEPAPGVFEGIAGLFDAAADAVRNSTALAAGKAPSETGGEEALRQGVLRRLGEAAANARRFAGIARKEVANEPLSTADYDDILKVGRAAEYHFLIFKSLANPEFALSNPRSDAENRGCGRWRQWHSVFACCGRRAARMGSNRPVLWSPGDRERKHLFVL